MNDREHLEAHERGACFGYPDCPHPECAKPREYAARTPLTIAEAASRARRSSPLEEAIDLRAGEVCKLVDGGKLNARSPAADALLSFAELRIRTVIPSERYGPVMPPDLIADPIGVVRWRARRILEQREHKAFTDNAIRYGDPVPGIKSE